MEAAGFLADVEEKPDRLRGLADVVERDDPWGGVVDSADRLVILGMGSSHYAGAVAASRLRRHGFSAVSEIASTDLLPALSAGTVVVAISASGESEETLDAVDRYRGAAE